MTRHVIAQMLGEWDADNYYAYATSQEDSDTDVALKLNTRPDRTLRLTDRRTRGCKYLKKKREDFDKVYEAEHPQPPRKELNGLAGIL